MPKIKFFHEKIAPDAFASGGNPDTGLTVIISGSRINADIGDDLVVYPDISLIARAADKLVVIDLDTVPFLEVGLELSLPRIARGRGRGGGCVGGLRRFGGLGGERRADAVTMNHAFSWRADSNFTSRSR